MILISDVPVEAVKTVCKILHLDLSYDKNLNVPIHIASHSRDGRVSYDYASIPISRYYDGYYDAIGYPKTDKRDTPFIKLAKQHAELSKFVPADWLNKL